MINTGRNLTHNNRLECDLNQPIVYHAESHILYLGSFDFQGNWLVKIPLPYLLISKKLQIINNRLMLYTNYAKITKDSLNFNNVK